MFRSQGALLIFFFITAIHAFAFIPLQHKPLQHIRRHNLAFFDGWFGNNNINDDSQDQLGGNGDDVDGDGIYTGSKRIITIPGK